MQLQFALWQGFDMTVLEDFYSWILNIEEDDPIPYEIKYIYFVISFRNNICSLAMGGKEIHSLSPINFEYFPLEAQFFNNESFMQLTEINLAKLELKQLLEDCFTQTKFKDIFFDKQIYFGEYGQELIEFKP